MTLTPTGFGIIVAVIVVVAENLRDRREDAALDAYGDRLARDVARYHCAAHGCHLQVTSQDSRGTRWTCAVCKTQSWVPAASPYDQQTDVSEWEREVGA